MITIRAICDTDKATVSRMLDENWGSNLIVSRGKAHDASALLGFIAEMNEEVVGLITYRITDFKCEIVSLDSLVQTKGVGSRLIDAVVKVTRECGCTKVWLITTNDNTHAIRFYQKIGFVMSNIYINAIEKSREIKPQIPLNGFDGIPILHEIEFELKLNKIFNC